MTEIEKELQKLKKEKLKNLQLMDNEKKRLLNELKSVEKKEIKNTIPEIKKHTIWERILKTLGIG